MTTATEISLQMNEQLLGSWRVVLDLSVKEVFQIMLGCELQQAEHPSPQTECDFTAMVGLAGKLCGVLSLRCVTATATALASRMLGLPGEEVIDQQCDAAGEVCNMVAGNFKAKLSGMQDGCMLSVPTVITGADYRLYSLADAGRIEIPFEFEGNTIWIALEIHS